MSMSYINNLKDGKQFFIGIKEQLGMRLANLHPLHGLNKNRGALRCLLIPGIVASLFPLEAFLAFSRFMWNNLLCWCNNPSTFLAAVYDLWFCFSNNISVISCFHSTRLLYLFTANGKHSVREDYCRAAMLINHKEKQTNSILHVQNNHDIKALIHECNKTCSPFYETHKNACISQTS